MSNPFGKNTTPARFGPGFLDYIHVPNPAAGVAPQVECYRKEVWNIISIRFQIVTSATVGSRILKVHIYGPTESQAVSIIMHNIIWPTAVTASQTAGVFVYQCAPANEVITPGVGTDGLIPHFHAALPSPWCLIRGNMDVAPDKVVISVNGIDATDQISQFHLQVVRYNQFDVGYE